VHVWDVNVVAIVRIDVGEETSVDELPAEDFVCTLAVLTHGENFHTVDKEDHSLLFEMILRLSDVGIQATNYLLAAHWLSILDLACFSSNLYNMNVSNESKAYQKGSNRSFLRLWTLCSSINYGLAEIVV